MNNYIIKIKVKEGQIKEILDRLTAAQENILDCYNELTALGVVEVEKENESGN